MAVKKDLLHNIVAGGQQVTTTAASNTAIGNSVNTAKKRMKTSYSIDKDINTKLKFIALKENTSVSDLVEDALNDLIDTWEKINGPIPNL